MEGANDVIDELSARYEENLRTWKQVQARQPDVVWSDAEWSAAFIEAVEHQEALLCRGDWWSGSRSLLGVIGRRGLEKVHSAVLAWVLDPNGRHGVGEAGLRRVLDRCGLNGLRVDRHVRVVTEEACRHPDHDTYGYTDIVVRAATWTVVIENKVWAEQHGLQLDLYFDAYQADGTTFIYLTPDGVRPHSTRPEVAAAYRRLSWRRDLIPELRAVAADARARGRPSLALEDYLVALYEEFT